MESGPTHVRFTESELKRNPQVDERPAGLLHRRTSEFSLRVFHRRLLHHTFRPVGFSPSLLLSSTDAVQWHDPLLSRSTTSSISCERQMRLGAGMLTCSSEPEHHVWFQLWPKMSLYSSGTLSGSTGLGRKCVNFWCRLDRVPSRDVPSLFNATK